MHIVRIYRPDGSNVDLCRRRLVEEGAAILAPGSEGSELAPGLLPDPGIRLDPELLLSGEVQQVGPAEVVIYKPRWGAFYDTALEAHLRGQASPRSSSAAAISPTARAPRSTRRANATFAWSSPATRSRGCTNAASMELSAIGVTLMSRATCSTRCARRSARTNSESRHQLRVWRTHNFHGGRAKHPTSSRGGTSARLDGGGGCGRARVDVTGQPRLRERQSRRRW